MIFVSGDRSQTGDLTPSTVCRLIGSQAHFPKLRTSFSDLIRRRRMTIAQFVIESQRVPFKTTQLMERQHINSKYHVKPRSKTGNVFDVPRIVRQPGYQHKAKPYRSVSSGKATCEIEDRLDIQTGKTKVPVRDQTP